MNNINFHKASQVRLTVSISWRLIVEEDRLGRTKKKKKLLKMIKTVAKKSEWGAFSVAKLCDSTN